MIAASGANSSRPTGSLHWPPSKKEVAFSIILTWHQSLYPLRGCPNNGVHLNYHKKTFKICLKQPVFDEGLLFTFVMT